MKYLLWGNFFSPTSFSNVMLHLAYYLKKRGHDITLLSTEIIGGDIETLIKRYMSHFDDAIDILKSCFPRDNKVTEKDKFDNAIYFLVDPHFHKKPSYVNANKHIFYTVWSHINYPLDWAKGLNTYDEVWTPSHSNAEAIRATGICNKKIIVVPHGYEPSVFYPKSKNSNIFRVGMCNSICNFKGADLAIRAFFEVFDSMDNVELLLQSTNTTRNNKGDQHGLYYKEYIDILNEYPHKQLKTFYYQKDCNVSEMADFYRSCDLILNPHRGDGFGLVPLESLACNVPVIVSEYHGPLDYIIREYPFWVCGDMSWTNKSSGRHHFPDGGSDFEVYKYFEPNKNHIKDLIIEAYKDWMKRSNLDCKQYFKGWTWDKIVTLIEGQTTNGTNI